MISSVKLGHFLMYNRLVYKSGRNLYIETSHVSRMQLSSILVSLFLVTFVSATFPQGNTARLFSRAPSDPCCKSCGPVGAVPFNVTVCPVTGDIFCGCPELVESGPGCRACIDTVEAEGLNTTFVSLLSLMEYFWVWCQCQCECRPVAEGLFGTTCNFGANVTCVETVLVEKGPECNECSKKIDRWFAGTLQTYIDGAKEFLSTGVGAFPGMFPKSTWHELIGVFRNMLVFNWNSWNVV
jgi:hypothetical protein